MNNCIVCGKETKNKKYCSNNCKYQHMSKEKSKCLNCGKVVDRCEVKYCSRKCYFEHRKKIFEENTQYNRCIICGKETRNEKYCSMECLGKDTSRYQTAIKNLKNEHVWTEQEIDYLKNNYGKIPLKTLEEQLKVKKSAIIAYATNHNIKSMKKWSYKEIEFLKKNKDMDVLKLSEILNRSPSSIINKFCRLNGFYDNTGKKIYSTQEYVAKYIKSLNIPFLEEVKIGKFRTDILIYNLDIEIQGSYWHQDERFGFEDTNKKERDEIKKEFLESKGIDIYYIWEYDLVSNPEKTLQKLKNELIKRGLYKE